VCQAGPGPHLGQLLAGELPVRLGPAHLARVALHLEVLVALAAAEAEHLRARGKPAFKLSARHACLSQLPLQAQACRTVQSLRTNVMPCPGYTVLEQNQQFSRRILPRHTALSPDPCTLADCRSCSESQAAAEPTEVTWWTGRTLRLRQRTVSPCWEEPASSRDGRGPAAAEL